MFSKYGYFMECMFLKYVFEGLKMKSRKKVAVLDTGTLISAYLMLTVKICLKSTFFIV